MSPGFTNNKAISSTRRPVNTRQQSRATQSRLVSTAIHTRFRHALHIIEPPGRQCGVNSGADDLTSVE